MFLLGLWLLIFIRGIICLSISGLDPEVWKSKATIYYENTVVREKLRAAKKHVEMLRIRPFSCHFENVFVDSTSIYFIANNYATAVIDLFDCCILHDREYTNYECKDTSVHPDLCYCFYNREYFPSIATFDQLNLLENLHSGNRAQYLKGTTWLMHHWSFIKHPDHFAMKLLEFRAYISNRGLTDQCCYQHIPAYFDRIVSMDYPVYPLTDYESLILKIVKKSTQKEYDYFSIGQGLNLQRLFDVNESVVKNYQLHSYCDRVHFMDLKRLRTKRFYEIPFSASSNNIRYNIKRKNKNHTAIDHILNICNETDQMAAVTPLPYWFMEKMVMTARYKNNFPEPASLSFSTFQKALQFSPERFSKQRKLNVVIIQRIEGTMGLRKILNLDDVTRTTQNILNVTTIDMWFISSKTPAIEQARYFHSFDVLISPHSSQLTNLIFAKNGSYVIEIQPDVELERTFLDLGRLAGVNYYVLNSNHTYEKYQYDEPHQWRYWDYYVNIKELSKILYSIKMQLLATDFLVEG